MARSESRLPSVLIADDDLFIHSVLTARLGSEFEVVAAASNADDAIRLAGEHDPDVAIIDVEMPGGGGLRAAEGIRSASPRTAIVAFSADESPQGVLDMLNAGATLYLRKDAKPEELAPRLRAAIAAHSKLNG